MKYNRTNKSDRLFKFFSSFSNWKYAKKGYLNIFIGKKLVLGLKRDRSKILESLNIDGGNKH